MWSVCEKWDTSIFISRGRKGFREHTAHPKQTQRRGGHQELTWGLSTGTKASQWGRHNRLLPPTTDFYPPTTDSYPSTTDSYPPNNRLLPPYPSTTDSYPPSTTDSYPPLQLKPVACGVKWWSGNTKGFRPS